MLKDEELREVGLDEFAELARKKFDEGIREHNPNGERNLCRLTPLALIEQQKNEIIDQWFYVCSLESILRGEQQSGLAAEKRS